MQWPLCRLWGFSPSRTAARTLGYDAVEYDLSFSNPQYPIAAIDARVYCQTDADRNRYDTQQLIDNMLQADYISDEVILRNRGELQPEVTGEISNRSKRRIRKNKIA